MLTLYKQGDARWGDVLLGKSSCTMKRYGCTTTDLTVAYNWMFNSRMSPAQCVTKLDYTDKKRYPKLAEGLILWQSLKNLNMKLISRIYKRDENAIDKALSHPTQVCLIEVNHNHWLFVIGKKTKKGYKIFDPLYGDIAYADRYRGNITGEAIIDKL